MNEELKYPSKVWNGNGKLEDDTVYVSLNEDKSSVKLQSSRQVITLDKEALKTMLGAIEVDRPEGLIPDVNRSTKDLPKVALPSDLFEGLAATTEPLGKEGKESAAWEEFSKSGLPEIINKLLYGFGWALKFFNDEGEGFDAVPIRVEYKEKSTQQTKSDAFPLELNDDSQAMNLETKLGKVDGSGGDAEELRDLQDNGASV